MISGKELSEQAVDLRKEGWTQRGIACVLGVSQDTVSLWLSSAARQGMGDEFGRADWPKEYCGRLIEPGNGVLRIRPCGQDGVELELPDARLLAEAAQAPLQHTLLDAIDEAERQAEAFTEVMAAPVKHEPAPSTPDPITHCKRGHPFDEENTRYVDGRRRCKACARLHAKEARGRSSLPRRVAAGSQPAASSVGHGAEPWAGAPGGEAL